MFVSRTLVYPIIAVFLMLENITLMIFDTNKLERVVKVEPFVVNGEGGGGRHERTYI